MTIPAINLSPSEPPQAHRTTTPYGRAQRWLSPFENVERHAGVSVFITQRAYVRICAHAGSDLNNEVGGWLVGKWCVDRNTDDSFIVVEASLPAPHTRHGSAYLTFTQDSQVTLYENFKERYSDRELLGWYHTHPRMGIFLSEYDTWLHNNFFPFPYQVALVIEPHSASGGFFIRQSDGMLDPREYFGFYEIKPENRSSVVYWRNLVVPSLLE
jgi:proteasome lid subunit RPN8/RPN11